MSTKLKVIKKKDFQVKGVDHVHYTCAYKGRVFGISSLRFDKEDITVTDDVLTLGVDVEVLKNTTTDSLTGETRTYLDLVPKSGLVLADF